jgi:hypothetical protein
MLCRNAVAMNEAAKSFSVPRYNERKDFKSLIQTVIIRLTVSSGGSPLREKGQDEGTEAWEKETGRLKGINAPTVAGQGRNKKIPPSVGDGSAVVLSASRIAGARAGHAVFAGARVELGARLQPAEAVRMRWATGDGRGEGDDKNWTLECLGERAWVRQQSGQQHLALNVLPRMGCQ